VEDVEKRIITEMLEKCIERRVADRHPNFEPVLAVFQRLDPARRKSEEGERRLGELVCKHFALFRGVVVAFLTRKRGESVKR